jgi:hypothetical protein
MTIPASRKSAATSTPTPTSTELPDANIDLQEQIRTRAYELYEQRGRIDGYAEQDWCTAESEVLGKMFKAAA